jgi:hypothetical protein
VRSEETSLSTNIEWCISNPSNVYWYSVRFLGSSTWCRRADPNFSTPFEKECKIYEESVRKERDRLAQELRRLEEDLQGLSQRTPEHQPSNTKVVLIGKTSVGSRIFVPEYDYATVLNSTKYPPHVRLQFDDSQQKSYLPSSTEVLVLYDPEEEERKKAEQERRIAEEQRRRREEEERWRQGEEEERRLFVLQAWEKELHRFLNKRGNNFDWSLIYRDHFPESMKYISCVAIQDGGYVALNDGGLVLSPRDFQRFL